MGEHNNTPKIIQSYLDYLIAIKNYSRRTVVTYKKALVEFFSFIKDYCNIEVSIDNFTIFILSTIKEKDIYAYLVYLNMSKENSAKTRKWKLCSIRSFYKWLYSKYPKFSYQKNPASDVPPIQQVRKLPKCLNLKQSKKLTNVFTEKNSKNPLRNNAIISVFLNCGLRISELINLDISDVNFKERYFCIIGKGNKERIVYFNNNVESHLIKYLTKRNQSKPYIPDDPLFVNQYGQRFSTVGIEKMCKKAYRLIGLDETEYTTHTLRHTAATLMLNYGNADIVTVKEVLGHSTIESTQIYTHVNNKKIRQAFLSNPLANFDGSIA